MHVLTVGRQPRQRPFPALRILAMALIILLGSTGSVLGLPATAHAATSVVIDGAAATGRTFDGVGAISGGGGNSRLLYDYPEPYRSQVLDYLFKPGYGAGLQMLKVEIGGDANSTDGAEPSAEHTAADVDYNRGYEWWLMAQAKARNPAIKLYGLAWTAPGWIGGGNFWSTDMINYYLRWIQHAKSDHGLTIDYIGGWNERGYNKTWYENLHSALATAGLATKVVGADDSWAVADDMVADTAFKNAIDVVGMHYPCGWLSAQTSCPSSANAVATGKPLWASENGSHDYQDGASLIRALNRDHLDGQMTAYINWPLVASPYQDLPYSTVGLVLANQPWSGNYAVGRALWATAHLTRFTSIGWTYLDSAGGYIEGDRANGSYTTLKSTNGTDWTTVLETTTASVARTVSFHVKGGMAADAVHVWATDMTGNNPARWMAQQADITPTAGSFSVTLQPGYAYTLTTTTPAAAKGTAAGPARSSLPLPYTDNLESYPTGREARYLSDMQGSFETAPCIAGRAGECLRQAAVAKPILWQADSEPYALFGDPEWGDYTVSADAVLPQAGTVELLGRANVQGRPQSHQAGYYLRVASTGAWSILRNTSGGTMTTLASGSTAALGTPVWHRISLGFAGSTITAAVDGTAIGSATDSTYAVGEAGLGTGGYYGAQFDNLSVTGANTPAASTFVGIASGKCIDDPALSTANGTQFAQWTCNAGANQKLAYNADRTLRVMGKCLDAYANGTTAGTKVVLWDCGGGANQQWVLNADGSITGVASGLCLDVSGNSTADGALLELWDCHYGDNQRWARV
ncbi:ricin-type beta-trefoil lectin domain protein [Streptomyces sp. NBC_01477]|uniref:ricin-type beta-trefoil lectin domain protein n=1 Tax=Streptomyces sp. NBC_01477 TaxID=2976015 RepID=UPI002E31FA15|nr:ricin-type beta-trefoil lectin domain protein [Streptomyces sp. NBC_01477]